jgi:hypothetical protein
MKTRFSLALTLGFAFVIITALLSFLSRAPITIAQTTDPVLQPTVGYELHHDTSPPLRKLEKNAPQAVSAWRATAPNAVDAVNRVLPNRQFDPKLVAELKRKGLTPDTYYRQYFSTEDPVIQSNPGMPYAPAAMPSAVLNFEGISQNEMQAVVPGTSDNYIPPDTVGDIGYDPATGKKYYVQWVNVAYAVWDVTGPAPVRLLTATGNSLWSGFGGTCESFNDGDPIVLFDQLANRWFISQFALPGEASGYHQCIAVSQTADPTGAWHRYDFMVSATKMNDYPHFGVWPDAYYMSVNQFTNGTTWGGAGVFAFDRARMLNGQSASFIAFDLHAVDQDFGGQLPADLDGAIPPPAGTPNYFFEVDDSAFLGAYDALRLWKFHVDWTTPANATFGLNGQPNTILAVAPFNLLCTSSRDCVPQPGVSGSAYLDAVADRLMHRVQYRVVNGQERVVLNHTVAGGDGRASVRWYEVRDPGTSPVIYQQGTYAPADGVHRWMGSLATDHVGNIALGYSVSNETSVFPGVRYAGRLTTDPLGTLGQGEAVLIAGGGSQTDSASRWGDYSSMNVDPLDDCTFWYTQQYYPVTAGRDWHTRIGSFRFASCGLGPQGTLNGMVTSAATTSPITGARLDAFLSLTQTFTAYSDENGRYRFWLPEGLYTLTAAAYGYLPQTFTGLQVISNTTTTQAVALNVAPTYVISGYVTDNATHDPLYAMLSVTGTLFNPPLDPALTDPATGFYSLSVAAGQSVGLSAAALLHLTQTVVITPTANATQNFALVATTQQGGVIGWVRNTYTGDPVAAADVSVSGPTLTDTQTDTSGYFEILDLTPGSYTVTATAALYTPVTILNVSVLTSNVAVLSLTLAAARISYAPQSLAQTVTFGDVLTDPQGLVISNTGLGPLTWSWQSFAGGFTPLQPVFDNFLVVNHNAPLAAQAITLALAGLGYTYDVTASTALAALPVAYLQPYQAVLFVGSMDSVADGSSLAKLADYLEAGGRLLIADNDLGYWNRSTAFYTAYLQANYMDDDAMLGETGALAGEDFMAGLTADISSDPYPDYYTPASTANIPLFRFDTPGVGNGYPAGSRIARLGYRVVYFAFDYNALGTAAAGDPIETTILERALSYLQGVPFNETPWLSAVPLSGTLVTSATQAVQLTWQANRAEVQQPGTYTGSIRLDNNDPAARETIVPAALTVLPAANQGLLTGVVSTTGVCDVHPSPLTGAAVQIAGQDGFSLTLATNTQGQYRYWLMDEHSPYSITVSHPQQPTTTAAITLGGGSVVTQNFLLRLQQPCIDVAPSAITATARVGVLVTQTLYLTSRGALPLNFHIDEAAGNTTIGGGPDAYGYTWLTDTYQFVDASGGITLALGDDDAIAITLPFTFSFYNTATSILNVGNNGWAAAGGWSSDVTVDNDPIASAPANFLAPFWDDLDATSGSVYVKTQGSAPQRRVIVEWRDRPHFDQVGKVTFEMILHENGNVLFQYQDVDFNDTRYNRGASATVGVRGPDAANGLQVSFNTPGLHDSQAICFVRPGNPPCNVVDAPWLGVTPISRTHLIGTPLTQQALRITLDAARAPAGAQQAQLIIMHNAPQPPVQIPVTFTVTGEVIYFPLVRK